MQRQSFNKEWNITIWRAIQCAGGPSAVARAIDLTPGSVRLWYVNHNVPSQHIIKLCELGGNTITPEELLKAISEPKAVTA